MKHLNHNQPKGKFGEDLALAYLLKNGHQLVTRNFYSRFGEIDLVTLKNTTVHIVEVKTRSGSQFGLAREAVTPAKLRAVQKTAEYFLTQHPDFPQAWQIDVVAIQLTGDDKVLDIEYIPNVTG